MRLIIAGGRDFDDWERLEREVNTFINAKITDGDPVIEIVNGMCKTGADKLGRDYARKYGYKIIEFWPEWTKYGKPAGPIRNEKMAQYGTHAVIFWDKKSDGTKSMLEFADKHGVDFMEINY